ncbi:amidohydrolase family protein [Streptomyces triticirhizae]|uniref:amidohydrolase family protein n=1 Tax=Streptomyces triticirhizae TaxID=2483353 RepID=UPI0018F72D2D|nr:amidohydrolase family protein [Streptomyces triticirhizae]
MTATEAAVAEGWPDLPPLVDQHCHGVLREVPTGVTEFAGWLSESGAPPAPGTSHADSALGLAVRRWCPPALGMPAYAPLDAYLEARRALGAQEANRALLRAAGIGALLVDDGPLPGAVLPAAELATAAGATAFTVTRLEPLAEAAADLAGRDTDAFLARLAGSVERARARSVAFKSVAAYRHGLHLEAAPPSRAELWTAAEHWLLTRRTGGRLANPVLLRHLLWSAAGTGLPLQLHTGFGDTELRLHRADPSLLTDFIRAVAPMGCPLVLLHCYPFHRQAAHLAAVYPHVYADLGLTLSHVGGRAPAVLAETWELAPFGKVLFSTDAYGLPELYLVGARQFSWALTEALAGPGWPPAEAHRAAVLLAAENARRLYRLPGAAA